MRETSSLRGMPWSRVGVTLVATALVLAMPAQADTEIVTLLDLDTNAATGCTVATAAGEFQGADQRLVTRISATSPRMVTAVERAVCTAGPPTNSFGGATPLTDYPLPWPVDGGTGTSGGDVVETWFPLAGVPGTVYRVGFTSDVVGDPGTRADALLTTDGAGGASIVIARRSVLEIPTLGTWGTILLALMLLGAGWGTLRRRPTRAGLALAVLFATAGLGVAWATLSPGGGIAGWTGRAPVATDPFDDAAPATELRAAFAAVDGDRIFLRVDVGDLPVSLQFLGLSDWHGQLDPLGLPQVSGAAVLAARFQADRATNPRTLTLSSGDAWGASPVLSELFDEQSAVDAMNLMGIDVDTFGNHNFDRGLAHVQAMLDRATYTHVASNLAGVASLTGVAAPYHLVDVGGAKVAVIGLTNPDAFALFPATSGGAITVTDPIAAAMAARAAAWSAGARVFVALAHLGARSNNPTTGPLLDFAQGVTGFHLILGGETDVEVNTVVNGARVVQNRNLGQTYARVVLDVVPSTGTVTASAATLVTPLATAVTPDPAVIAMLAPYRASLTAKIDAVIGIASALFPRGSNIERLQEVALGNLVADAMRARYGTQLAIVNSGGLRAPLPSSYLPANTSLRRTTTGYVPGPPYDLVRGDPQTVLPFGNLVVTRTVTGAQLWTALENSVSFIPGANGRFLQISGFGFTYSASAPAGSRITEVHLQGGTPIPNNATTYTLALLDFVNTGGDGYAMFVDGEGKLREVAVTVLAKAIAAQGTITPVVEGRIVQLP